MHKRYARGGSVIGEKSREACEVLGDRHKRLLSLPKSGAVVAHGTYVLSGRVEEIDVAQWSRLSGWIDAQNGDFLEEIDNKLVARWTGLSFSAPRKSRAFGGAGKKSPVRPTSRNLIDGRAPSTGNRRRPVGDAVAKPLKAKGLDSSPGSGLQLAIDAKTKQIVVRDLLLLGDADSKLVRELQGPFQQDLSNARSPENYQYVTSYKLAEGLQIDETTVRKRVTRCRIAVRDAYKQKFGEDPPEHLLIENKPRQGYRLNPRTRFVAIGEIESTVTSHSALQPVTDPNERR